ncbi:MAG: DUF58 domain-containing protein [Proteobacteria bacterium]|nr:DUF58 domain-containing protein [Pseudomonadota bacterium]
MGAALRRRLGGRIERWARARQGLDTLPLRLQARRLYILPTRAGLVFALLLFVMLIGGLNYSNSLALFLTFMLAGFMLVGMHECQRTLRGLELARAQAADCHAGDEGLVELRFVNPESLPRRALAARTPGLAHTDFELQRGGSATVQVKFHAARRGRHRLERIELSSTAPFGLFRCWTWLYLPVEALVYPRLAGTRPLPAPSAGRLAQHNVVAAPGEDEWAGLRAYQSGDSPRSIAWKSWARGGPLLVAQYSGSGGSDYLFSFAGLESLDLEARLSQIAVWIGECAQRDAACGLQLPAAQAPTARGAAHRTALLRQLALYGEGPA